ncbi:hypothetical protein GALL_71700 [mine drainage metagenome]|uniref:Uncharacterized protein n=1 Tax=mine drainage metagenome TaxID=410659 RepID=A0A1J5SRC2_9ZZZZ
MRKQTRRTVRQLRIPITKGLHDQFAQEMHFSLMKANLGHFSTVEFDKIGRCFNTIYGALDLKPPKDKSLLVAIEGAMRAMNECAARGDTSGIWTLRITELAAVRAGVKKAEEALALLDVTTVYQAMKLLDAERAAETERKVA